VLSDKLEDGRLAELFKSSWRLVNPEDSRRMLWQIAHFTNDPNILPPHVSPISSPYEQVSVQLYQPRIPPKPSYTTPSMLMITLPEGAEFVSGFIVDSTGATGVAGYTPQVARSSVAFKSSQTTMDPRDIQRAVVSAFHI